MCLVCLAAWRARKVSVFDHENFPFRHVPCLLPSFARASACLALDSIAQADADQEELQQLAETLGLKEVDEPLHGDDLQGLVQSSAYEPGDAG